MSPKKNLLRRYLVVICGFFPLMGGLAAQATDNPFELVPRLAPEEVRIIRDEERRELSTGNPFDILPRAAENREREVRPQPTAPPPPAAPLPSGPEAGYTRFLVIVTLLILILATILITLFRSTLQRSFRAFINDNILNQLHRDRESVNIWTYRVFYGLFFLNTGLFLWLLARHYDLIPEGDPWRLLLLLIAAVTAAFLLKHLLLRLIAVVFPVEKEVSLYNFTIMIFNIVLGIVLLTLNLFIAYAPEELHQWFIWLAFGLIALVYLFRSLRGLLIANQFLLFHKFHFLLYICTVEIAPIVVLLKLIIRQL